MNDQRTPGQRVLHVISGDLWAGAEVMAHTLLTELNTQPDLALHAAVLNQGALADKLDAANVPVTVLDETKLGPIAIYRRLKQLATEFRPQLVHTHRQKENVLGALAARAVGARSLRTVHGWTEFPKLGLRIDKRLVRALDNVAGERWQQAIIAVSDELAAKLADEFERTRVHVIENGVNLKDIRTNARAQEVSLPGVPGRLRVGIIARLVPVKRHDRFLAVARALLQKGPDDYDFYIVGDGPRARELSATIKQMPDPDAFHTLGFRHDAPSVLAELDVLVVCSDHEGIPMNVLEAAALGVPIATVPLPSIETIIHSGAIGVVAEDNDAVALAEAVLSSIGLARKSHSLKDDWRYSAATMAANYRRVYDELVAGPPG